MKRILDTTISNNLLLDVCIDIVIDFTSKTICLAGFSKETEPFVLHEKIDYMGVRLRPGVFHAVYHTAEENIMDAMVPFTEIEEDYNLQEIFLYENSEERINILRGYLMRKMAMIYDRTYIIAIEELYEHPSDVERSHSNQVIGKDSYIAFYQRDKAVYGDLSVKVAGRIYDRAIAGCLFFTIHAASLALRLSYGGNKRCMRV